MKYVKVEECAAAGLDPKEVARVARGLSRYARKATALGLCVFGGSSCGSLRFRGDPDKGDLVVATLDGYFDGGAGDETHDEDGLTRGECQT